MWANWHDHWQSIKTPYNESQFQFLFFNINNIQSLLQNRLASEIRIKQIMRNCILAALMLLIQTIAQAKNHSSTTTVKSYIDKFSSIAQSESKRSGIPASIILAQGILESEFGNSNLCQRSNNHFGIKWKKESDGNFVYSLDDDYNKEGKRIPSKFLKYSSAETSFRHHSDFLMNREHYKPLFKYSSTNYEKWAHGLRACGYATDATYGSKLIELIKRLNLAKFDLKNESDNKEQKNKLVIAANAKVKSVKEVNVKKFYKGFLLIKTQSAQLKELIGADDSEQEIVEAAKDSSLKLPFEKPSFPNQDADNLNFAILNEQTLEAILNRE